MRNPDETFEFIALDSLEETFKLKDASASKQVDIDDRYEQLSKVLDHLNEHNLKEEFLTFLDLVSEGRFP